jgi:hypothetical protein
MQQTAFATPSEAGGRRGRTGLGTGRQSLGMVRSQRATAVPTRSQDAEPHSRSGSAQAATPISQRKDEIHATEEIEVAGPFRVA